MQKSLQHIIQIQNIQYDSEFFSFFGRGVANDISIHKIAKVTVSQLGTRILLRSGNTTAVLCVRNSEQRQKFNPLAQPSYSRTCLNFNAPSKAPCSNKHPLQHYVLDKCAYIGDAQQAWSNPAYIRVTRILFLILPSSSFPPKCLTVWICNDPLHKCKFL